MNTALWVVQVLLALVFLAVGIPKATQPIPRLSTRVIWTKDVPVPLVRFIGVAEVLGALGLILPAVTGILSGLTVAAAVGLAIVQASAIVFHLMRGEARVIVGNIILLALLLFVVYGRLTLAPLA